MLNRVGLRSAAMHSDRDQSHRERTLADFKEGRIPILVATDVASRGLDVRGICAVVNYDLANNTEDYVHRIGRTGRAGMQGESFTFITRAGEDVYKTMGIVELMQKTNQVWPPTHFFMFPFCEKILICLEGKSMTPHRGNTILFRSSQQLPRLRLRDP